MCIKKDSAMKASGEKRYIFGFRTRSHGGGPESAQEGKSNGRRSSIDGVSTAFIEKINDKQISTEKGKSGSGVAATHKIKRNDTMTLFLMKRLHSANCLTKSIFYLLCDQGNCRPVSGVS